MTILQTKHDIVTSKYKLLLMSRKTKQGNIKRPQVVEIRLDECQAWVIYRDDTVRVENTKMFNPI